jgi:hypothetical protein
MMTFKEKKSIHSLWKGEIFCHNEKECEPVFYDQFMHIFPITVPTEI